jgi:hypothetical protein
MMLSIFRNFEPTSQVQSYLSFILKQVAGMLPRARATTSMVIKQGTRYLCLLEIDTEGGLFKVSTFATNPILALDRARRDLLSQVGDWRALAVVESP